MDFDIMAWGMFVYVPNNIEEKISKTNKHTATRERKCYGCDVDGIESSTNSISKLY